MTKRAFVHLLGGLKENVLAFPRRNSSDQTDSKQLQIAAG